MMNNSIVFSGVLFSLVAGMTKTFAELKFPGRLIAVEGLDGSGKPPSSTPQALAGLQGLKSSSANGTLPIW
jgi:hypothetical protein